MNVLKLSLWILLLFSFVACKTQEEKATKKKTTKEEKPIEEPIEVDEKPIIYLYPTEATNISVKLNFEGELTHTYPVYDASKGWEVTALPDGTLFDQRTKKEYYALFWEGESRAQVIPTTGFVIKGSETIDFLEEKLAILGLNRREANEFIVYWLPKMENNPYNFIHFAQESYTKGAQLDISPTPETLIRVFMVYEPLKSVKTVNRQELQAVKRKGFTVVEWGGTKINSDLIK